MLLYVTGGLAYGEVKTYEAVNGVNITGLNGTNTSTSTPVFAAFGNTSYAGRLDRRRRHRRRDQRQLDRQARISLHRSRHGLGLVPHADHHDDGGLLGIRYSSHITDNILRVGVNYRFGGPVVAKY